MIRVFVAMLSIIALPAMAADDSRVSFLEQEVRNLQRQVLALSQQVDELRTRPSRLASPAAESRGAAPAAGPSQWIDASKWRQLHTGMSELDVIHVLGPPTSMREEGGARVLLYAMEMGPTGFLGGSVTLRNRAVTDLRQPTLQ